MTEFQSLPNAFTDNTVIDVPHTDPGINVGNEAYPGTATAVRDEYLETNQIFSNEEFMCCQKLGNETYIPSNCCSGFGVLTSTNAANQNVYTCKLPEGTDLSVYFNRFISGEGVGEDEPGGGLEDTDFDANTGEPLTTASVYEKLNALGEEYCENGTVRRGGAFGRYQPEPKNAASTSGTTIYSIVDSSSDLAFVPTSSGSPIEMGYEAFEFGFRWNHHVYCNIP
jgi:hypothetical protein